MGERGVRYMPALDGLRAAAVIAVLLYHGNVSWAKGGYFGVDAFFVLSGFLITSLLLAEWRETGTIDLKAFWTRRARRLLPAIALVGAVVAVYAARYAAPIELHQLRRDGLSTLAYFANWNQIVTHQSYFEQLAAPSPLKHTWSLAIEEQFYLVWPLLMFALLRRGRGSRRVVLGACVAMASASAILMAVLYHAGQDPSRVYYGTDTRAQSLLIGAGLAVLLAKRSEIASGAWHWRLHAAGIAAAAVLVVVWSTTSDRDAWQYRGGFALTALLVATVIASVTRSDPGPLGRALSVRPLRYIGSISYGLYLWHWPIYVFLSPDRTGLDGWSLLVVRLATTLVVAVASFSLVEQPIRHGALRGWTVRVATPAVAVALALALVASTARPVPVQFQAISASQLQPPPAAPPTPPPSARPAVSKSGHARTVAQVTRPLRVMLVGDSVARSMDPGITAETAAHHYSFWDTSVPGCGLATDVGDRWFDEWRGVYPQCLPGWRDRWPGELKLFKPDVVVGLFGAQDAFDRRIDGRVVKFDTLEGMALAKQDLQDAITMLGSTGARVVLLTAPYYVLGWPQKVQVERSPLNPVWIDEWNALERSVVAHNSARASVLDLNRFLDPNGTWTDTVNGIKVRTFDRCHLSPEGAAFVAKWLTPQLPPVSGTNAVAATTTSTPRRLRRW